MDYRYFLNRQGARNKSETPIGYIAFPIAGTLLLCSVMMTAIFQREDSRLTPDRSIAVPCRSPIRLRHRPHHAHQGAGRRSAGVVGRLVRRHLVRRPRRLVRRHTRARATTTEPPQTRTLPGRTGAPPTTPLRDAAGHHIGRYIFGLRASPPGTHVGASPPAKTSQAPSPHRSEGRRDPVRAPPLLRRPPRRRRSGALPPPALDTGVLSATACQLSC